MPALDFDLVIEQGADFVVEFPALNPAGQPQSLSGWQARGQIRTRPAAPTVLHTLDVAAAGSTVTVTVPAAASSAWAWRTGSYAVELVDPNATVTRFAQGRVYVSPETTR